MNSWRNKGLFLSKGYLSESERNSSTGVELASYDVAVQQVIHNDTELSPRFKGGDISV